MLFGLGSLLLWLFTFLGAARSQAAKPQPIRIALGVFLFCVGVSYVLAMTRPISPDEVSPGDVALIALASWAGTLLLTHDGLHERGRLDTLVWRFSVCGAVVAALGIAQVLTREMWVDQLVLPGLTTAPPYTLGERGGYPRPAGTAIHPIEYGVILAMLLPITLHVGFHHTHRSFVVRWLPAIAVALIIPFTSSRSAYLGALVALIVCLAGWSWQRRGLVLGVGLVGALTMAVIAPNFINSVVGLFAGASEDPSIKSRTDSFALAEQFIAQNPWFGRGLGTFLPKYRIFDNQYLLLLVTIGVIGTLTFITLGVVAAVTILRLAALTRTGSTRDLAMAIGAAIIAGFTCLFMFDAFAFPMTMGTLFLVLGLAGALGRIEQSTSDWTELQ